MELIRRISLQAPIDSVWDLLARRFHEVGVWAAAIDKSGALNVTTGSAGIADRVCDTPDGVFKEQMVSFDETMRTFSYLAYEGLPGFVRRGGSTWRVRDLGGGKTEVSMHMKFLLSPVAEVLMGWMLKRQMGKAADSVLEDLKVYAETGKISDRKRAALDKYNAKQGKAPVAA